VYAFSSWSQTDTGLALAAICPALMLTVGGALRAWLILRERRR